MLLVLAAPAPILRLAHAVPAVFSYPQGVAEQQKGSCELAGGVPVVRIATSLKRNLTLATWNQPHLWREIKKWEVKTHTASQTKKRSSQNICEEMKKLCLINTKDLFQYSFSSLWISLDLLAQELCCPWRFTSEATSEAKDGICRSLSPPQALTGVPFTHNLFLQNFFTSNPFCKIFWYAFYMPVSSIAPRWLGDRGANSCQQLWLRRMLGWWQGEQGQQGKQRWHHFFQQSSWRLPSPVPATTSVSNSAPVLA